MQVCSVSLFTPQQMNEYMWLSMIRQRTLSDRHASVNVLTAGALQGKWRGSGSVLGQIALQC